MTNMVNCLMCHGNKVYSGSPCNRCRQTGKVAGQRWYHTDQTCPFCDGKGCDKCEQTGHAWIQYMGNLRCWCSSLAMRHVDGVHLCRQHARYVDDTGKELLPDQLEPHPEEAHLYMPLPPLTIPILVQECSCHIGSPECIQSVASVCV